MAAVEDGTEAVLVHDAARALTPEPVFHRVAQALAAGAEAVIPVIPVVDTVKTVDADQRRRPRTSHPSWSPEPRPGRQLRAVQTPQGFNLATLRQRARGGRRDSMTPGRRASPTTPCWWSFSACPCTPSAEPASH